MKVVAGNYSFKPAATGNNAAASSAQNVAPEPAVTSSAADHSDGASADQHVHSQDDISTIAMTRSLYPSQLLPTAQPAVSLALATCLAAPAVFECCCLHREQVSWCHTTHSKAICIWAQFPLGAVSTSVVVQLIQHLC